MITFYSKFQVFDSLKVHVPKVIQHNENFWCSFNTKKQLIMCNVIYLGEDETMKQYTWYDGIIHLPDGEKFPPYCVEHNQELCEPIHLHEVYSLNVGSETVGLCELLKVFEIKENE